MGKKGGRKNSKSGGGQAAAGAKAAETKLEIPHVDDHDAHVEWANVMAQLVDDASSEAPSKVGIRCSAVVRCAVCVACAACVVLCGVVWC